MKGFTQMPYIQTSWVSILKTLIRNKLQKPKYEVVKPMKTWGL